MGTIFPGRDPTRFHRRSIPTQFYAPTTNVDILKDTYTINAHLVNQAALAFGRYKSLDSNQDDKPHFTTPPSTGLLNTPPGQPTVGFPGISFTGGAASPQQRGRL